MTETAEPARRGLARGLGLVGLFLVVFVGVQVVLRAALPGGGGQERVEVKFDWLDERVGEYDTLFVGSSRTFRGFDPETFDRATAAAGVPTRSFNFGVPGAWAFEMHKFLERLRDMGARPKWVLIDPEGLGIRPDDHNHLSRAVIDWHDLPATKLVLDYIDSLPIPDERKRELSLREMTSCAYNLTNVGRGLKWVDALLGRDTGTQRLDDALGPGRDGFVPLDVESTKGSQLRHKKFLRTLGEYEELVGNLNDFRIQPGSVDPYERTLLLWLVERIEEMGAVPIFVTQAGLHRQVGLIRMKRSGEIEHLLRYDLPRVHPDLYEVRHRWDATHHNRPGAVVFSRKLAGEFVELVRSLEAEERAR